MLTKRQNNNKLNKENHDPFAPDHPENTPTSHSYLNINCLPQNGKQSMKQNAKTKDEWDSYRHIQLSPHSHNTFTLALSQPITQAFDTFDLSKKKKCPQTLKQSHSFDIWLTISHNKAKLIDVNLCTASDIAFLKSDKQCTIFIRQDLGRQSNIYIRDDQTNETFQSINNDNDTPLKINYASSADSNLDSFFKFIEYLNQHCPRDMDIPNNYAELNEEFAANKVNKDWDSASANANAKRMITLEKPTAKPKPKPKHNKAYLRSKQNSAGFAPNIPKTPSKNNTNKHKRSTQGMTKKSRAKMMATAGDRSHSKAADAAMDRYSKTRKTPVAGVMDTAHRRKQLGGVTQRKHRNQKIYRTRTRSANAGNQNAKNRINDPHTVDYIKTLSGTWPMNSGTNVLHSMYRDSRKGEQIGFKNLGNTCYINAILRSINSLECLSNDLRRQYIFDVCGMNVLSHKDSVYRSYLELLLRDLNNSKGEILDPWIFKKIIGKMDAMFASYSQQDAHELLSFLLSALHEQIFKGVCQHFEAESDGDCDMECKKEELEWLSPIHNNFHFEIEFEYECTECGYKRNKIESFREMSLDLPLKKDQKSGKSETKEEEGRPWAEQEMKEAKEEKKEEMNVDTTVSVSVNMKEEMDCDDKEDTELDPFEKWKLKRIEEYDGGCPTHKDKALRFQLKGQKVCMICETCNDAIVDTFNKPQGIDVPGWSQSNGYRGHSYVRDELRCQNRNTDYNGNTINNWTLNELLKAYFVRKTLEYKCEQRTCGNNKVYVTSWFKQIPRVLVFHIKRFIPNYTTNSYTKSHDQVKIEKEIDINLFCNRTLSLPTDSFELLHDNQGIIINHANISNHGNDIYHKIFANKRINTLDICKETKDLPSAMQTVLKREDYKEPKSDDDDIIILNQNVSTVLIPPKIMHTIKDMTINVGDCKSDEKDLSQSMETKSEYMSEREAEEKAVLWTSVDNTWQTHWSKYRCETVLKDNKENASAITYAKMYLQYWNSVEWHKSNTSRKRKREDNEDSQTEFKQPSSKKQKTEGNGSALKQSKITDYAKSGPVSYSNGNSTNNSTDDSDLARALQASLDSYNNYESFAHCNGSSNMHNTNVSNEYKCVVNRTENSGNINEFESVCEQGMLPNNVDFTQYNLQCIVRHLGNNYTSGHYVTDVLDAKDGKDEWKRHDDQYVSSIDNDSATDEKAQKNAYIFFYVHQSAYQQKNRENTTDKNVEK